MSQIALAPDPEAVAVESQFVAAPDGLKLHVRRYGDPLAPNLPVVCLPGLARTEADFEALATHLASDSAQARCVFALDYRGRGRSGYDRDWRNYNLAVELADVSAVMTALDIHRAVFVGTSRGGMLTMLQAAARPMMIAGAILNDIGPVIEPKGLMRIKGYVGKMPRPKNFSDGATILRRLFSAQFPKLNESDWLAWARRSWEQRPDGLVACYDPKLGNTLKQFGPDRPIPALWAQFDSLAHVPVMVVRGTLSDILSLETVATMRQRRPDIEAIDVPDQGHAPLLSEPPVLAKLAAFISRCDAADR